MLLLVLPSCSSYLQFCYNGLPTPHTPHTPSSSPSQPPAITIYHHHHPHCYYRFHHTQVHVCTVYLVIHLVFLYIQQNIWYCLLYSLHSFIYIYMASRPNACKCNVNLFRFVIVLFSKVLRQWGICNIFFYSIYMTSSCQPAAPTCRHHLPPSCRNHAHRSLLQDPPVGSKIDLQEP